MLMNMMDMMEVFQNMNDTTDSDGNTDPAFDPMSMMKNMLAPEQQAMFDMYNTMSSQETQSETETEPQNETQNKEGEQEHD